jgi:hypothetical protein
MQGGGKGGPSYNWHILLCRSLVADGLAGTIVAGSGAVSSFLANKSYHSRQERNVWDSGVAVKRGEPGTRVIMENMRCIARGVFKEPPLLV